MGNFLCIELAKLNRCAVGRGGGCLEKSILMIVNAVYSSDDKSLEVFQNRHATR